MSFLVELTPRAYQDINEIVDYITDQSGIARAENIRSRIVAGLKLLEGMPTIYRLSTKLPGGRDLLFNKLPYVAPFEIVGQRVIVVAVYHSRRDWQL